MTIFLIARATRIRIYSCLARPQQTLTGAYVAVTNPEEQPKSSTMSPVTEPTSSLPLDPAVAYLHPRRRQFLQTSHFHKILVGTQVFARMTPNQKAAVVTECVVFSYFWSMCSSFFESV
jgi:hypothetical protein